MPGLRALAARLAPLLPALPIVQLCHGGSRAIPALTGVPAGKKRQPLGARGRPGLHGPRGHDPEGGIARVVGEFATAARRAADAGFAGIELHGANGYLFTQFISRMTNRRDDAYGGSVENRARFSREVVRACRANVPRGSSSG